MRHFSTLLCIIALGLTFEMGTSCTKQTLSPVVNNTVKDLRVIQKDSTGNQPPTNENNCGGSGQGN